ncbi:MAG: hypothetical protein QXJ59_10745, partial [Thermofilaceae archaeon]
ADVFELRERLEKLEWEYQTRPLEPEEEKSFVERIRGTETLLRAAERYNECLNRIRSLRTLVSEKRKRINELNTRIKELSQKYLEVKTKFTEIRSKANEMRSRLSELIEKKEALRRKADEYHNKLHEKFNEMKKVKEDIERTAILLKAAELSQVLSRRRMELYEQALKILERYRQGERLTLDEFKLLMEFGLLEHAATTGSS